MKQCSISLVIRKMQNKHRELPLPYIRMAKIQNTENIKDGKCSEEMELSYIIGVDAKGCSYFEKHAGSFLDSYDTAIPLPCTYPKEMKIYIHMKIIRECSLQLYL